MQLIFLSDSFYTKHRNDKEILQKKDRPYACLSVQIDGNTFAIPFRHHIEHKYGFFTFGTCGLDYTKSVIIEAEDIGTGTPTIDQKEYNALRGKDSMIITGLKKYIRIYKKALSRPNDRNYDAIRKYSALQYFKSKLK